MTSATLPPYSKSDILRRASDAIRASRRESLVQASQGEMQRRLSRIEMHRDLEREARKRRATLEEILSPAYTVALPSESTDTRENVQASESNVQVPDGTETDVEVPSEHTSHRQAYAETEPEVADSNNEPFSPRSTDSTASSSSSQIINWDDALASPLEDS